MCSRWYILQCIALQMLEVVNLLGGCCEDEYCSNIITQRWNAAINISNFSQSGNCKFNDGWLLTIQRDLQLVDTCDSGGGMFILTLI